MKPLRALWRLVLYLRFRIFQRHRFNRLSLETVGGYPILVLPTVFNPKLFFSTEFLLRCLEKGVLPAEGSVLDMGTGSGVAALAVASQARKVVAVDVNPEAVRCARINVLLNRVQEKVEIRQGDLFEPVVGESFDLILFNPPYLAGHPVGPVDLAFRSEDIAARFASGLGAHLKQDGEALVVLSSQGRRELFLEQFRRHRLSHEVVARENRFTEVLELFRLRHAEAGAFGYTARQSSSEEKERRQADGDSLQSS